MYPYINLIENFDAKKDYTVTFTYLGSERITTNEVTIREAKTGSQPVYTRRSTKFDKNHTIPKDTLVNGGSYWAKIRVQLSATKWTEWSPEMEFLCLSTPIIDFDGIDTDSYVYNNDLLMTAIYRQEQGERVETYQFTLMNANKTPITTYPVRIPDQQSPNVFTERVIGLVRGKLYYIGCRIITKNGINFFTTKEFIPQFVTPTLDGALEVKNNGDDGQVLIQSFLKQMIGTPTKPFIPDAANDNSNNFTYMDDDWIIIPKEMPLMYARLGMAKASDFVIKVWCKNVPNGIMLNFSEELGEGIHIKFVKHDNYITCEKEYMGVKSRTRSNIVPNLRLKEFYLYVKVVEFRVQMKIVPKA